MLWKLFARFVFNFLNCFRYCIGNHNPGAGGWPTIKYFNKETGYEGKAYTKRTSKAMCDELGDEDYMQDYVITAGKTSLCNVHTKIGCSEKEAAFVDKWNNKDVDSVNKELVRLIGLKDGKMKAEALKWTSQRAAVLQQLAKEGDSKTEL